MDTELNKNIMQFVPRATEPGISLIIEQECVCCVRNERNVSVVRLIVGTRSSGPPAISSLVVKLLKKCWVR